jgi:nucleoside triphosphatase
MSEQKYPEPTVGALIFNPEGKALFIVSPKWHGKYAIPGGHIELGETIEQALKREVKEETNLEIFDIEFLTFQEFIYGAEFYEKRHFIFIDYICKTNDTNVILNEEGDDHVWVPIDEALNLPLEPYTRISILRYLEYHSK